MRVADGGMVPIYRRRLPSGEGTGQVCPDRSDLCGLRPSTMESSKLLGIQSIAEREIQMKRREVALDAMQVVLVMVLIQLVLILLGHGLNWISFALVTAVLVTSRTLLSQRRRA